MQTHHDHSISQSGSATASGIEAEDDSHSVGDQAMSLVNMIKNRTVGRPRQGIDRGSPVFAVGVSIIVMIGLVAVLYLTYTYNILENDDAIISITIAIMFFVPPLTGGSIAGWYTTEGISLVPAIIGIGYPLAYAAILLNNDPSAQSTVTYLVLIAIPVQLVVGYVAFLTLQMRSSRITES